MAKTYAHDAHCNTIHEAGPEPCPPPREDNDRSVFEAISSATLLKPGDRVLLHMERPWSMQEVDQAKAVLHERAPGVTFVFVTGS